VCGNGITEINGVPPEQCDGPGNNGVWITCNEHCQWAPFLPAWLALIVSVALGSACCCLFCFVAGPPYGRRRRREAKLPRSVAKV
jgi:hypothetical protein